MKEVLIIVVATLEIVSDHCENGDNSVAVVMKVVVVLVILNVQARQWLLLG